MKTRCPHCSAVAEIPDEYTGKTIACPKCKQSFMAAPRTDPKPPSISNSCAPKKEPPNKSFWYKMSIIVLIVLVCLVWSQSEQIRFDRMIRAQESLTHGIKESSMEEIIRTGYESQRTRQTIFFGIALMFACVGFGNILYELRVIAHRLPHRP
jgi:predicted Zn finger-like uncharacterized protein